MLTPEFRDEIQAESPEGKVVLTFFDGCVVGFTPSQWAVIEEEVGKLTTPSRKARNFMRVIISGSEELTLDKQGRVTIPALLRKKAMLDKEVILAGSGERFEIWNVDRYEALMDEDYDDVSVEFADKGLKLPF